MRDIYLYGALEKFGKHHRLDVKTTAEAVKALCVLHKGFRQELTTGLYRVVRGDAQKGLVLGDSDLSFRLGKGELHIIPVPHGSGRGVGKVILGTALIAGAFIGAPAVVGALGPTQGFATTAFTAFGTSFTYGNIAAMGVSLALSGISQALSPRPKAPAAYQGTEERPSFLFNGVVNSTEQGGPVPVWYGRVRVGSIVASGSLIAEEIPV